ncbi:unnamed protein product [Sympodiomycopsis kandeliae]
MVSGCKTGTHRAHESNGIFVPKGWSPRYYCRGFWNRLGHHAGSCWCLCWSQTDSASLRGHYSWRHVGQNVHVGISFWFWSNYSRTITGLGLWTLLG